jgi:flap endonuclease-1
MGITGLIKLLKDKKITPQVVHLKSFGPGVVAIDAYNYMHKFLCNRNPDQFILSVAEQIYNLLRFKIIPVYIFDGKVQPEKSTELERREKLREQTRHKLAQLEAAFELATPSEQKKMIPLMITYRNQLVHIKEDHIKIVKRLLRIFRLPWLDAPADAEALACHLNAVGKVDFVLTEDSDCLVFNCIKQVRGFTNSSFNKLDLYVVKDIHQQLGLTNNQMIDLAILLGNDYSPDLLPPGKAFDLMKEYGSIVGIIKNLPQIKKNKKYLNWIDKLDILESGVIDTTKINKIFKHEVSDGTNSVKKIAAEFERPGEFQPFSEKRVKFLKMFLIKYSRERERVLNKDKIFKFLLKEKIRY